MMNKERSAKIAKIADLYKGNTGTLKIHLADADYQPGELYREIPAKEDLIITVTKQEYAEELIKLMKDGK